jgi:hypothetical protein
MFQFDLRAILIHHLFSCIAVCEEDLDDMEVIDECA